MSANVSYQQAAEDIEYFTGIRVSRSVQQRLVHRQGFAMSSAEVTVEELSVDGGNIRIRTAKGEPCRWKGYKAVCLHEQAAVAASFGDNAVVIDWVNTQPLPDVLTCIGDGHDGIWNIVAQLAPNTERREVLDWFHLIENLHSCWRVNQLSQSSQKPALARNSRCRSSLICRLSTQTSSELLCVS